MSAYIVNNETICAIVKGFEMFNTEYSAEDYKKPNSVIIDFKEMRNGIGQSLLEQNYKSVNCRYRDNQKTPKFNYKDVEVNEGIILGCINCYEYQACETNDYETSQIHYSLQSLKNAMLDRYVENSGYEVPWGYEF